MWVDRTIAEIRPSAVVPSYARAIVASLIHDWFGWDAGSVLTNLVASMIWVIPTAIWAHRVFRCHYCWRPARVPIKGTPHHSCRKHAIEKGHVH